ncbi:Asp23/Gls24 family envelope stress response protein [Nocardioides sp. 1609]|uniref:Asp23/Gls24 family envelope stress response protein n=1 Tax=Nocardioides sp. 1609 TaxID=2508327 RepID=UPI0014317658|nr:Asp23/Gls24 family envelope stress response protein [Nocardioides sp. 1609]
MAEPAVEGTVGSATPDEVRPDERGTLEVRVRAIQHVVEQTVLSTPGTVAHRTALGRLRGSNSPRADITMQGRSARVAVDVACVWPCHVAGIAARVRDTVRAEAARITGVHLHTVDVTVHTLGPAEVDQERRRVE